MRTIELLGTDLGTCESYNELDWDAWQFTGVTLNEVGKKLLEDFPEKLSILFIAIDTGHVEGYADSLIEAEFTTKLAPIGGTNE